MGKENGPMMKDEAIVVRVRAIGREIRKRHRGWPLNQTRPTATLHAMAYAPTAGEWLADKVGPPDGKWRTTGKAMHFDFERARAPFSRHL